MLLGVVVGSLSGPFPGTAWASAGCTAAAGGAPFSYVAEDRKVLINQAFDAGDQITIAFSSYSRVGGAGVKTFRVGQGDPSGNAGAGAFGSLSLGVAPATRGPFTVPAGGITRFSMSIFPADGAMNATGTVTCSAPSPPTVSSLSPATGPTAGGTSVTVTGTGLTGASGVTIGGVAATGLTVLNATTITATTPAHAPGAVNVVVTTPAGTGTGTGIYTYVAAPTVTAISPPSGTTAGGTAITITGADFSGATAVTIGGAAATGLTVLNATTITGTSAARVAGVVDVVVTTPGGAGTGTGIYTYAGAPTVTAISPTSGPIAGGTAVTITGTGLTGATAVTIGGVAVTGMAVLNATTITATTAAHAAGTVALVVTTPFGSGTGAGIYTYANPPAQNPPATTGPTDNSPATGPTVRAVSPTSGAKAGGTRITITGADFTGATAVTIGGVAATGVTVVDAGTIVATTPAHAAGSLNVVVTTPAGTGVGASLYTYTAPVTLVSTASMVTQAGQFYSQANAASGGTPGYTFRVSAGSTPAGTDLDASTGLVSGTPTTKGDFSYTIQVTDSSATPLTATQVVTGAIAPIATTILLTSSLDPSLIGQPVTLTATVTPASATGTVTVMDGTTTLCDAVSLASGVATCTVAFAASGPHPIAAVYGGSTALGGSTSAVLVQTVNDQKVRTVEAIAGFMSRRNDLIAASEPDGQRQIERLIEADASGADAFGSFTDRAPIPRPANDGATAMRTVTELLQAVGSAADAMRFDVATSLRRMLRFRAQAGQRRPAFSRFDVSIEGKYGSFRDKRATSDLDGHFGLLSIGADYVLNRNLLVGAMAQFDSMRQRSLLRASEASGHGWMAGPYATLRLAENVFWQARAGFGGSRNDVSPFQSYTDEFATNRWLISTKLAGRWSKGRWRLSPSVSVAHIEDVATSYTDAFGVLIPEVTSRLGQARLGPEVGYHYQFRRNLVLEPHAGLQLVSNFAGGSTVAGGPIDGEHAAPPGTRGRAEIGLRMARSSGFGVDFAASYDGIGAADYPAISGRVMVRVPLHP